MSAKLAIDEQLLEDARVAGGFRTKRETVDAALRELIQRRQRLALTKLFGKIDFDPKYDYKRDRRRS